MLLRSLCCSSIHTFHRPVRMFSMIIRLGLEKEANSLAAQRDAIPQEIAQAKHQKKIRWGQARNDRFVTNSLSRYDFEVNRLVDFGETAFLLLGELSECLTTAPEWGYSSGTHLFRGYTFWKPSISSKNRLV